MLTKIYAGCWFVFVSAALFVFLTGSMTMMAFVVFGFVSFGLVFMGMMGVLPSTVVHPAPQKIVETAGQNIRGRIRDYKETLSTDALAVRKPKYP